MPKNDPMRVTLFNKKAVIENIKEKNTVASSGLLCQPQILDLFEHIEHRYMDPDDVGESADFLFEEVLPPFYLFLFEDIFQVSKPSAIKHLLLQSKKIYKSDEFASWTQ